MTRRKGASRGKRRSKENALEEGQAAPQEGARQAQGGGSRGRTQVVATPAGLGYRVLGVDHVEITTPTELEDEVKDWYRSCLGLVEVVKPEDSLYTGTWFRAGDQELHLTIDEHNPPKNAHFALLVDAVQPVIDCLRAQGCHIEQAGSIPGRHRFYTRDPAGNRIEIIHDEQPGRTAARRRGEPRAKVLSEEK